MLTTDTQESPSFARQAIFELEGTVSQNRAKAFIARSQVAENSTLANQNYNAAFLVNRRIANENTDALFRCVTCYSYPPSPPPLLVPSFPLPPLFQRPHRDFTAFART